MSLHTKYRPKTFDEVLGQTATVKALKRITKDNRAHAFLLVGPAGTGKTSIARIIGSQLIGNDNGNNLIEIDASSRGGVDEIKSVVSSTLYRAIGGSAVKFVILDEAHRLSAAAWTVLLKPVEEPPAHVYYAFCTTELGKIPKAILTRCQRFELKPVKEDVICDLLLSVCDAEKLNPTDEILELIAENSNGSPRQALVYLEACHAIKDVAEAREIMRVAGQSKEIIDLARWLVAGKGHTWAEAMKLVKALEGTEAESIRIVLQNYLAAVLLNTKNDKVAANLLGLVDAFRVPYQASDKLAPLLYSLGLAMRLDA